MMTRQLSRRTLLRGAGVAMALPLLEAMMPLTARAQSGGAQAVRLAFLFVPNGVHMPDWTPQDNGGDFTLPYLLEPLAPVKNSLTVFTGLTQHNAFDLGDGAGDHARSAAAWLTGCHPKKTEGADIKLGISADQVAAQFVGKKTRFASLEIGCERGGMVGNCDSGYSCAYRDNISWRGEQSPVAKEIDPRLIFDRLFNVEAATAGQIGSSTKDRQMYQRSVLDFVMDDAQRLSHQLGGHDRQKLDEYLSSVRELERRVQLLARQEAAQSGDGGAAANAMQRPSGRPDNYGDYIRLMGDMMVLAFQADLTRVCTFMFANEGSNRPYREIGVPDGHHDLSHHGGSAEKQGKIRQINRFHTEQLAYIAQKMQSIKEGGSTLLDNTMLVYGGGISDGDRHNHNDLPILLLGKGGNQIKANRHLRYPDNTPMTNLFVSMYDKMGIPVEKIGDSTGKLTQLV